MATYGYLRVSTIEQDNDKFRDEVLRYSNKEELGNVRFIEEKVSGTKDWRNRRLGELVSSCVKGDSIIVPELSRLARSISQIYDIISVCQDKGITLHILKQNLVIKDRNDMNTKIMVSTFALTAELERDFIAIRTKEALAVKKSQGIKLGRPCGTGKSRLDGFAEEIHALKKCGVPVSKIAGKYGVNRLTLSNWLEKHTPEN